MKKMVVLMLIALFGSCRRPAVILDLDAQPVKTTSDEKYADVFTMLDGEWSGVFKIYEDSNPSELDPSLVSNVSLNVIDQLDLKLSNTINVNQVYKSITPYFQTVDITDIYPKDNKEVKSRGVNKVENGQMWCVVKKPNELIVHEGALENAQTIIWSSEEHNPYKKEYFREEVSNDTYEIIGYGYYNDADPTLNPPLWFHGLYKRKM